PAAGEALPTGMQPIVPLDEGPKGWLVSSWPVGQSPIAVWRSGNVRAEDGALLLVLDDGGTDERPFAGGELQSRTAARTGTWRWFAQAPEMTDGAVFGMFLYRADHAGDPWREYDFEFV